MDWMGNGQGLEIIFQMKFIQYPFQVQISRIKVQYSIVIVLTRNYSSEQNITLNFY